MSAATSLLKGHARLWRTKIHHFDGCLYERAAEVFGLSDRLIIRDFPEHGALHASDGPLWQDEQCPVCGRQLEARSPR